MARSVPILNGPNLNLLKEREAKVHGRTTRAGLDDAGGAPDVNGRAIRAPATAGRPGSAGAPATSLDSARMPGHTATARLRRSVRGAGRMNP
jgi:hypothetical protein